MSLNVETGNSLFFAVLFKRISSTSQLSRTDTEFFTHQRTRLHLVRWLFSAFVVRTPRCIAYLVSLHTSQRIIAPGGRSDGREDQRFLLVPLQGGTVVAEMPAAGP